MGFIWAFTRVCCGNGSSPCKVTCACCLSFPLEVAIGSIRTMPFHCIRQITDSILKNGSAISSSSTSIVQCLLKRWITHIRLTDTPSCTFQYPKRTTLRSMNKLTYKQKKTGKPMSNLDNKIKGKKSYKKEVIKIHMRGKKGKPYHKTCQIRL